MTAQAREMLTYNDEEYMLNCLPFSQYIQKNNLTHIPLSGCTALWRGYMGKWAITDNKLYITSISGSGILYDFEKNKKELIEVNQKIEEAPTSMEYRFYKEQKDSLNLQRTDEIPFSLMSVFNSTEKVIASWYSGTITASFGELKQYVHSGFSSVYEKTIYFSIKEGIVENIRIENSK